MTVTLRLDVPALERLIGGNTEVEVQLRQSVVEEFARRKLNSLLKEEGFAKFLRREADVIRTALDAKVAEHVGEVRQVQGSWGRTEVHLTDATRLAIAAEADRQVTRAIRDAATKAWASREPRIVGELTAILREKTDALVRGLVKERMDAIAASIREGK